MPKRYATYAERKAAALDDGDPWAVKVARNRLECAHEWEPAATPDWRLAEGWQSYCCAKCRVLIARKEAP